jgi:RNA polymerase sigma-70 factor (ECF subfamily)
VVSREVLAACRRGDPAAFEEVVRATHRLVYTQALRLVRDRQDAEDVTQETFLRVFRGLSGFRGDAQFETWLYRITANAAMTHLRRRGRFGDLLPDDADERLEAPSGSQLPADTPVDRQALAAALASLPDPMRIAVVLKDVYGLSCLEIAEMEGSTEGAIKVRLHRARKRLKDALFEQDEADEM